MKRCFGAHVFFAGLPFVLIFILDLPAVALAIFSIRIYLHTLLFRVPVPFTIHHPIGRHSLL
jgi:hypothetical protein